MQSPSVFAYNDFRRYLADWHAAQLARDADYSKSEVSRRLGLPRTRSYFTDVLSGKPVTRTFIERFVQLLALDREEAQYFRTLLRFNQADTPEERELAFDQLVSMNRTPRSHLEERQYLYYKSWWNGAIRALLATGDYTDDPTIISKRLRPNVTPGKVREALDLLLELALVERDHQGFLRPTTRNLATPEASKAELVRSLQLQQLDVATKSLLSGDDPQRRVFTNTLSVSSSGYEMILNRIEKFRSEVRSIVHRDPEQIDQVALVTLTLVPLTRSTSK